MFLFAFLKFDDLNSSIEIVSKYVCIATDLYISLYIYNFDLSSFPFCLIYTGNIADIENVPEAAIRGVCSIKKVFLEIPQNSQENTCARVSFSIRLPA